MVVLMFCVPGGEFFGNLNEFRDFFTVSQGLPLNGSGDVLFLFAKQPLPFGQTVLKGRNQFQRFCRIAFFALFMLLLLAALSRVFICICKLFRFSAGLFFDYLVNALLLGGQAPPLYSFS
ncbi:MAG: hypothetical protein LBG10_05780 [Treponema sp.]|nr:hypothetical protein [Treponema sp.]